MPSSYTPCTQQCMFPSSDIIHNVRAHQPTPDPAAQTAAATVGDHSTNGNVQPPTLLIQLMVPMILVIKTKTAEH